MSPLRLFRIAVDCSTAQQPNTFEDQAQGRRRLKKRDCSCERDNQGLERVAASYQALNKRIKSKLRRRPSHLYIGGIPRLRNHPSRPWKAQSTANKDVYVQVDLGNQ